jgi:hypothetical protein
MARPIPSSTSRSTPRLTSSSASWQTHKILNIRGHQRRKTRQDGGRIQKSLRKTQGRNDTELSFAYHPVAKIRTCFVGQKTCITWMTIKSEVLWAAQVGPWRTRIQAVEAAERHKQCRCLDPGCLSRIPVSNLFLILVSSTGTGISQELCKILYRYRQNLSYW